MCVYIFCVLVLFREADLPNPSHPLSLAFALFRLALLYLVTRVDIALFHLFGLKRKKEKNKKRIKVFVLWGKEVTAASKAIKKK